MDDFDLPGANSSADKKARALFDAVRPVVERQMRTLVIAAAAPDHVGECDRYGDPVMPQGIRLLRMDRHMPPDEVAMLLGYAHFLLDELEERLAEQDPSFFGQRVETVRARRTPR
jgi:hypothetical protein